MLRGCAMLRVCPDDDWLLEFFSLSLGLLPDASGPQLANMGWALALLSCQPPRQWLHEWGMQLRKRAAQQEGQAEESRRRPMGTAASKWHGVGYSVHAERAAVALQAFGVRDVKGWCAMLRTPVPAPLEGAAPMRRAPNLELRDHSAEAEVAAQQLPVSSDAAPVDVPRLRLTPLPADAAQQALQAAAAVEAAFRDGVRQQCVELLVQPETGQDDWPGGIRQQFRVTQPVVESILRTLKQADGLQGPLSAEIWDQGDAVAAWTGAKLAAILFPTAATIERVRYLGFSNWQTLVLESNAGFG